MFSSVHSRSRPRSPSGGRRQENIFPGMLELQKEILGINDDTQDKDVMEMYMNLTAVKGNPSLKKRLFDILLIHMRERELLVVSLKDTRRTLVIGCDVSGSMNSCHQEEIIRNYIGLYEKYKGCRIVIVPFGMFTSGPIYTVVDNASTLELFVEEMVKIGAITGTMIDHIKSEDLMFIHEFRDKCISESFKYGTSAQNLRNLPVILEAIKEGAIQLAIVSDGMITPEGGESGPVILQGIINSIPDTIKVRFLPIVLVITSSLYGFNHGSKKVIEEYFAHMPGLIAGLAKDNLLGARMVTSVEKFNSEFSSMSSYRTRNPQEVEEELRKVMEETTSLTPGKPGISALGKWGVTTISTPHDIIKLPEEVINSLLKALIDLIENTMSEHLRSMASSKEHPFQKMFRLVILRNRKGCPLSKKILNVLSLRGSSDENIRRMLEEAKRVPREELDEKRKKVSRFIGTISPNLSSDDVKGILNAVYDPGMLARVASCFDEDGKWEDMTHDHFETFMRLFLFILADENNLLNGWRLVELAYVLVTRLEPGTDDGIPEALHRRLILFLSEFDFGSLFPQEIEDIIQVPELGKNYIQSLIARINNPSIPKEIVAISRRFFLLKKLRVVLLNHYWLRCHGKAKVEKIIVKNTNGNPLELVLLAGTPENGVYAPRCLIGSDGNLTACDFCFDSEREGQINALFEVTIQLVSQIRKNLREQAEDPNSFQGTSEDGFRKLYGSILIRLEKFFAGETRIVEETVEMSANLKGLKIVSGLIKNLSPEIRRDWKKLARIMKSGKFSFHDLVSLRDFDIQEFVLSLRTTLPVTLDKVKGDHEGAMMGSYLFSPDVVNKALILLAEVRPMQMLSSIIDDYDVCCICMSNAKKTRENTTSCCGQILCLSCQHNQARKLLEDEEIRPTVCPLCRNPEYQLNPPTELISLQEKRKEELDVFFSINPELLQVWLNGSTPIGTCQNHGNLCVGNAACGRQTVYNCKRCIEELQVGEDVKHCPHCDIPYERIDGCNVMVCGNKKCMCVFCHQCGHKFHSQPSISGIRTHEHHEITDEEREIIARQNEMHAYSCGHYPGNNSFSKCKGHGVEDYDSDDGYDSDW